MVEFVIILPLLLLLLFATVEFGVLFVRWETLSNAAREGARAAIVFRDSCDSTAVINEVEATVTAYAASAGITLAAGAVNVTGACGGAGSTSTVTVSSPYTFQVVPGFSTGFRPTLNLLGTSAMRNEGTS
jgi:Flp pilus assembly protein TadG